MPHIDTLATARRLEQAGLPTEHARAVSEAISDAIRESQPDWSQIATKEFVRAELKELELRIAERLRSQMPWFFATQVALISVAAGLFKLLSA
jgi:soluble lytic murein transglycosylase-like protein